MCLGKRNEQQRGREEGEEQQTAKLLPKVVWAQRSERAHLLSPEQGPLVVVAVVVAPLSLRILHRASASGRGWGCWREPKWNSKWKNVSRFAAQAALKEIIFSYKQTHTRTQHTHTHTHTYRDTHALTYTHITHTPRSTSNSSSILRSWQHIQSGKKQQQKSFHRLPFYIKKLKQTNRKIKAKKQKKPSCALYWLRTLPLPKVPPVINYRYHQPSNSSLLLHMT